MRCAQCDKEIALAAVCPYCGHRGAGPAPGGEAHSKGAEGQGERPRGVFRGRLSRAERRSGEPLGSILPTIFRYFSDPRVAGWRKAAIVLGLLYVVSPVDLVPGAILPVVGWLDDAVVATMAWRLLTSELARYRRR